MAFIKLAATLKNPRSARLVMLGIYKYSYEEAVACCMHRASAEISGGIQSMPLIIKSALPLPAASSAAGRLPTLVVVIYRSATLMDVERHKRVKRLCFSGAAQWTNVNAGKGARGLSLND